MCQIVTNANCIHLLLPFNFTVDSSTLQKIFKVATARTTGAQLESKQTDIF